MKQNKPKEPTSTAYMRGWKDRQHGKNNENPFTGYLATMYDKGYNDATERKGPRLV